jgi:hypothetical protein
LNDSDMAVYTEEIVYDGLLAANIAILPWVAKTAETIFTSGSNGDSYFLLPDDLYDVESVFLVEEGLFIPRATMAAYTSRGSLSAQNDWIISPRGYLSLSTAIDAGNTVKIHYIKYWGFAVDASNSDFVLETPPVAHQGMVYYAAAHAVMPSATDMSTLGGFKTRIDSGNPLQNPMLQLSDAFRRLFYEEMKLLPPFLRAR